MNERVLGIELSVQAWAVWNADGSALIRGGDVPPAKPLPASLRRRVTDMGRRMLEAAWVLCAGLEDDAPRMVLSSRHGEYSRTLGLLSSLADGEDVSPADFSLAVHHGLAGLLSIATGNRAGHTAIAAGGDTLGSALSEAASCLASGNRHVLLMHFDEVLPPEYAVVSAGKEPPVAFALLLGEGGVRLCLEAQAGALGTSLHPDHIIGLLRGESDSAELGGERHRWRLCRAA
ncbi:MAG: beta-ketoacyl synthase chain length factor [Magnetospirillum gryphiswaldense]|nr:beta-ketoacyl synthase chain length factor [Magnetospirillum gryphiswaldense]